MLDNGAAAEFVIRPWTVNRRFVFKATQYQPKTTLGKDNPTNLTYFVGKSFTFTVPDDSGNAVLTVETPGGSTVVQPGKSSVDGGVKLIDKVKAQGGITYQYKVLDKPNPPAPAERDAEIRKLDTVELQKSIDGRFHSATDFLKKAKAASTSH